MKNLLKFAAFAMIFAMGTFITSCGSDDEDTYCYECDAIVDSGSGVSADAWEGCEGDEDGGVTLTVELLDDLVVLHEGLGGTCTKK